MQERGIRLRREERWNNQWQIEGEGNIEGKTRGEDVQSGEQTLVCDADIGPYVQLQLKVPDLSVCLSAGACESSPGSICMLKQYVCILV